MSTLLNTFIKLVKINSISLDEKRIVSYLAKELRKLGLKPRLIGKPQGGNAKNIIVNIPGTLKGPRILFCAHVDTVFHKGSVKPRISGNYVVSDKKTILGADNKAGVAVILELLKTIKKQKLKHLPLQIVLTVAEEIGLNGSKAIPKKLIKADFGLVLDGGDVNEVINQAPGQINITVTVIGKAAHAGTHPEKGVNAIQVASKAIAKMRLGRIDKETTANIGIIKGGRATNIITEKVEIKGEARSHDPEKLKKQVGHMKQILLSTCKKDRARARIELITKYRHFEVKKSNKYFRDFIRTARALKIKPIVKPTGGGSDANIFNKYGVKSLIIGVGANRIHTSRERLKISEMVKSADLILKFITGG